MNKEMIRSEKAKKVTLIGFFINALLTGFKFVAGIMGNSSAMIADAVHSLSDFLTDIVVLISVKLTSKPADYCHNYGHGKYETIATLIISTLLALVGFQILKAGIFKVIFVVQGGILPKPGIIALLAAFVSAFTKEILYRYTLAAGKKIDSPVVMANAWHHRSDAFSSLATLLGIGGAIGLGEKWTVLDPLTSIVVSVFIFKVAYDIIMPSLGELVEKSLPPGEREKVEQILKNNTDILNYHHLRTRRVGNKAVIECHIMIDETLNIKEAHDIAEKVEEDVKTAFKDNTLITIHIEPYIEVTTQNFN